MKAKSIWFNGLSGAGKSTLANRLYELLKQTNNKVIMLDGDIVRSGINRDLGFSMPDRKENIRRVAEINKLFLTEGFTIINSFIAPTEEIRQVAKEIILAENTVEISLITPLAVCKQRDPKGLYKLAEQGLIKEMTGMGSVYEYCINPDIEFDTSLLSIEDCLHEILYFLQKINAAISFIKPMLQR
jgi:adenylyl-sulfate kinase